MNTLLDALARMIKRAWPIPYWPDEIEESLGARPVASMLEQRDGG